MQEDTTSTTATTRSGKSNGKWKTQSEDGSPSQLLDSAKQAYDSVIEKASDMIEGFSANPTAFIKRYPVQAAVGGVVVGLLLAATMRSRRTALKE